MAAIELRHVYKYYEDGVAAVQDFNLEIEKQEFVVFIGPSGCGKSTTLRMIAGLEEISDGKLLMDGKLVNHVKANKRDVAMVFQNYALYPHMSVYDNIAYSLKLNHQSRSQIREEVMRVAQILDIVQILERKPGELSGGQKQRVAIGRAMVRKPKVFLMDEPLSNLDAKLRGKMRAEISELYRMLQTTFIYVTHDQIEAMTLGTKIVVMKEGIVQQIATPKELYQHPANVFVAQWAAVGIKVEVQTVDFATLMSVAGTNDYDILAVQYTYAPVDPYPDVAWLLGGEESWTGYGDDSVNEALAKTQTTSDIDEIKGLYSVVDQKVQEDVPMFSAYIVSAQAGVNKRLVNATPSVYGFFNNVEQWEITK